MTNHARPWRLLADAEDHSESFGTHRQESTPRERHVRVDADFDELVVGDWLHVEMMSEGVWWMRVGNAVLWVSNTKDGPSVRLTEGTASEVDGRITGGRDQRGLGAIVALSTKPRKSKRSR
jgi:hypothetical protein